MASKKLSFEDSIQKLDEIVKHLEKGDLPLNDSIKLFQEGTKLIADCNKLLNEAEQKVVALKVGASGDPVEVPFEGQP